jgi:hypothetical protein
LGQNTPLVVIKLPDVVAPVTDNAVSVPTLVMLVCAAVLNVPVSVAPVLPIVPAFTVLAMTVPLEVTAPTAKLVSVPTLVMFGCALAVTVPATLAALGTAAKLASSSAKGIVPV